MSEYCDSNGPCEFKNMKVIEAERDQLNAEIKILRAKQSQHESTVIATAEMRDQYKAECERLREKYDLQLLVKQNDKYREALEFYAKEETYHKWTNISVPGNPRTTDVEIDKGKLARKALAPLDTDREEG